MKQFKTVIISIATVVIITVAVMILFDPFHLKHENKPFDPGTPEPAPHEGVFVADHGTMIFNGDGKYVAINFDEELAELIGLPSDSQLATYRFLSGDLPPHGSVNVRYDVAKELELTADGTTVVIQLGIAAEDGQTAQITVGTVTEDTIPLLFTDGQKWFNVIFYKF